MKGRLLLGSILLLAAQTCSSPGVVRCRCVVTVHNQILCYQPNDGRMFRPERRYDEFILEVPAQAAGRK